MMLQSITLSVDGGSDDAADLGMWLGEDDDLRGHVRMLPAAVPQGALGAELAQLLVSVESGGAATALASVLVAWLRRRTGSVSVRLTRPDGTELQIDAERVRVWDAQELRAQVSQLEAMARPDPEAPGGS